MKMAAGLGFAVIGIVLIVWMMYSVNSVHASMAGPERRYIVTQLDEAIDRAEQAACARADAGRPRSRPWHLFCERADGSVFEVAAPACSNAYNQLANFHDNPMRWMLKRCGVQADRRVLERADLL